MSTMKRLFSAKSTMPRIMQAPAQQPPPTRRARHTKDPKPARPAALEYAASLRRRILQLKRVAHHLLPQR